MASDSSSVSSSSDEIDLAALIQSWWRHRVRLVLHAMGAGVAALAVLVALVVLQPSIQQSTLLVRLEFKGAEEGKYPNGLRFSPGDLVVTPVLQEVYRRNQLESFVEFDEFKSSISVVNRNPSVDRLRREFASRLEQKNLNAVDREKVEAEYQNRLQGLRNSEFTLVLIADGKVNRWPTVLAGKVLEDTMKVWADQARERGVFAFEQDLYSSNLLLDIKEAGSDYFMVIDRLRLAIQRITSNIDELDRLSGARLLRVGTRQTSLGEMRAALQDHLTFDLQELNSMVFSFGLFRQPKLTEAYLKEQLFRIGLEQRQLQNTNEGLSAILTNYNGSGRGSASLNGNGRTLGGDSASGVGAVPSGGYIPQLSDGFLDRIIDLSGQKADITFRQELARQIIENERRLHMFESERSIYARSLDSLGLNGAAAKTATGNGAGSTTLMMSAGDAAQLVEQKLNRFLEQLATITSEVALLHRELSAANLEPSKVYRVLQPLAQERVSTFGLLKAATALIGMVGVYVGLIMLLVAIRAARQP